MKALGTYISESVLSRHGSVKIPAVDIFRNRIKEHNSDVWWPGGKTFDEVVTSSDPYTIVVHEDIYLATEDLEFAVQVGVKNIVLHACGLIFVDSKKTRIDCKSQLTIQCNPKNYRSGDYKWIISLREDHEFVGINFEASKVTNLISCNRLTAAYSFPSFVNCRFRNIILSYDKLNSLGGPAISDKLKNCKFDGWCYLSLNTKGIVDDVINGTKVISVDKNSKTYLDYAKSAVEAYAAVHPASDILKQLTGGVVQKLGNTGIVKVEVFCEHTNFKFYKENKITFTSQKRLLKYGDNSFTMKDGVFMQICGSDTEAAADFIRQWGDIIGPKR